MTLLKELRFPDSLGLLYSVFTYFAGFKVNSGEYKIMGLAPYGEPKYASLIKDELVEIRDDGSIRTNQEHFTYSHGLRMTGTAFERLIGSPPRQPESSVTQREMDLARSIQEVTEEVMLKVVGFAHRETGQKYLCLAGGVPLNCVANGRIVREGPYYDLWVQPASGDAGGALGVALAVWHRYLDNPRSLPERMGQWVPAHTWSGDDPPPYADGMNGAYLGPHFSSAAIHQFLEAGGLPYPATDPAAIPDAVADLLANGKVVGLHQGRMEFGPRALGGRSILGDPRSPKMQSVMNLKIKYRESFRPFAPSVLREEVGNWFALESNSPYMLIVIGIAPERRRVMTEAEESLWGIERLNVARSEIQAVTHVDYSARIQTVRWDVTPFYLAIIDAFRRKTGCPVIVNTSFNVRGEPIVCTPEDAYRCFMRTEMDALVLGDIILDKSSQPSLEDHEDWRNEFQLD